MLLALITCHLSVLVAANPFYRYPFVFLLDVGNEELQKTNTEQIRLSTPGGSVALRYPAIGDGDPIGHVRVSGIDFGTDLKANIVDGGPGYKYVVIVLMGNPGVPYDAVLTVQTVKESTLNSVQNIVNNTITYEPTTNELDANDSAEDLSETEIDSDTLQSQNDIESNAELMQPSSKVYKYVQSEENDENDNPGEEIADDEQFGADTQNYNSYEVSEDNVYQKDIHIQNNEDLDNDDQDVEVDSISEDNEFDKVGNSFQGDSDNEAINTDARSVDNEINAKAEKYITSYEADNAPASVVDSNLYSKYEALKPHLFGSVVYSQDDESQNRPMFPQDAMDYEDPGELEQAFNDVDVQDSADKYRDSNNNDYFDSDDGSAVAY